MHMSLLHIPKRMWYTASVMKLKRLSAISTAAAILFCGCSAAPSSSASAGSEKQLLTYKNSAVDAGFDTVYAYSETGYDAEQMKAHFETGVSLFRKYNDLFDIYNDYEGIANLKTINDNAGIAPVECDREIIEMLKDAQYFYDLSGGRFDITSGALMHVWHEYRTQGIDMNLEGKTAPLPSEEELSEAAKLCGWDKVQIDEEAGTVFITEPGISLDVGGIAKGYTAERIAQAIAQDEIVSAAVDAGRNVRTINTKADGSPWNVRIVSPDGSGGSMIVQAPGSCSFVTSGDYERFYVAEDGKNYHHIIDTSTMYPAAYYRSVTILTEDSAAADCLSTALFCMSVADGKKMLERYAKESGKAADAVWIMDPDKAQEEGRDTDDYHIVWTEGLTDRIIFE